MYKNIVGKKFGRLLVLKLHHIDKEKDYRVYWECLCDCGNRTRVRGDSLRNGKIKSCGCLALEFITKLGKSKKTHGKAHTKIYNVWRNLKGRCNNRKDINYFRYGGRGIKVCKRWLKFENFYKDMGDIPNEELTLDRIDNNKGYLKENCKWATKKEQAINRRSTTFITFNGETLNQRQWAKKLDISYKILNWRLKHWSVEKSLSTPLRKAINNVKFKER